MTIGNTLCLSSPLLKVEEEAIVAQNQGISSILGSDTTTQTKTSSLRRTLSADMSPAKLLSENGFSFGLASSFTHMKKIAAFEEHATAIPEKEEEESLGQDDVWGFIQSQKKKVDQKPEEQADDVWGAILAQKDKEDGSKSSSSEQYVPSVMKRSKSCLDERSLEICTESLGSETGSAVFSSRAPSESGDAEEEKDLREEVHQVVVVVPKNNFSTNKKLPSRSFPPPLLSLPRPDAPSLFMKPHRENGRLVLQAVPVPSQNCFHAARQDGRLLLTFADDSNPDGANQKEGQTTCEDDEEQLFGNFELEGEYKSHGDETETEEEEEEEDEYDEEAKMMEKEDTEKETMMVMDQVPEIYSCDVTNVHRSAIVMKKLMRIDNRKPKWNTTQNFNISVNNKGVESAEEGFHHLIPQSLPWTPTLAPLLPAPPPTAATSFNAYDYFWRAKSTAVNPTNIIQYPVSEKNLSKVQLSHNLRENKADYLLPLFKGCKEEPRRSHLAREPHCIATS